MLERGKPAAEIPSSAGVLAESPAQPISESCLETEILETDWDTAPQEITFLSALFEYFGPFGRKEALLFRLLDCGVDETWFVDDNRRYLYLGLFTAALKLSDTSSTVRIGAVVDEAEKISGEKGWATKEIRTICDKVGYFNIDEFLEEEIPLWWHKLKKPKAVKLLGKLDMLLTRLPPTLERLQEIDDLAAATLDTWRADPDTKSGCEELHANVRDECLQPIPADHTIELGVVAFDEMLNGGVGGHNSPDAGRLIITCARPGGGKSLVASNIASRLAVRGHKVVFWSFEMGQKELAMRDIAMKDFFYCRFHGLSNPITYNNLKKRSYTPAQRERLQAELYTPIDQNLSILIGNSSMEASYIANHMRAYVRRNPSTRLFVIDHLGLLNIPNANRAVAVGDATRQLKVTARELGVDILLLCQLNRGVEGRDDKRPTLSDLRDSGRIEEDSDIVLGLFRPSYYDPDPSLNNILEIISLKNRQGKSNYSIETNIYLDSCAIVDPGSSKAMEPDYPVPGPDGDFL
jgi:KaiC/GvpD/RAD55 family RecA-like ATPase